MILGVSLRDCEKAVLNGHLNNVESVGRRIETYSIRWRGLVQTGTDNAESSEILQVPQEIHSPQLISEEPA